MGLFDRLRKNFVPQKQKGFLSLLLGGTPSYPWQSKSNFISDYDEVLYLNAAVRKRAESVGKIQFELYKKTGKEWKRQDENPFLSILNKPNDYQTKTEFFELYQTMKDLTGEVYVWLMERDRDGVPQEMHILRSDRMEKAYSKENGSIIGYKYNKPTGGSVVFEPDEVLFSAFFSPKDAGTKIQGTPIAASAALSMDTSVQLDTYQNSTLKNGGRVETQVSVPADNLSDEQLKELKESFQKEYAGAKKAGRPFFSYGGIEMKPIGLNMNELAFNESKRQVRDDILMVLGVPKILVAQTEDVNYASAREARLIFLEETVKPLLGNLIDKLNYYLVTPEDLDLRYIDPTPEDEERKLKKVESGLNYGYLTINEARKICGYDEVEGGDELLVPLNKIPLGEEADTVPEQEEKNFKKQEETKEFVHPLRDVARRNAYRKQAKKRHDKWERKYKSVFRKYAEDQEQRILDYIGGKSWKRKNLIEDSFNMEVEVSLLESLVKPLMEAIALEVGQETFDLFSAGDYKPSETVLVTLAQRAEFLAREANDTTLKQLQKAFSESLEEGEGRDALIKRIRGVYGNITDKRANTIAATESHTAIQKAVGDGYRQAGVPIKIWVSVVDGETRPSHLLLDGEEQMLDSKFSNDLMEPGDPSGPPEEVINCRCTI